MSTHLVTFSDENMSRSRELCASSAERVGGINDLLCWHHEDLLKTDFYRDNVDILSQPRGLGFWAWKPWIILQALEGRMTGEQFIQNSFTPPKDGDILIYSDAGIEFIAPVSHIIDRMDQNIFLFGNNWEHAHWCKRDVVETVWPTWSHPLLPDIKRPVEWGIFGKQCQASVIFFRVSIYTRAFVREWLKWCLFEGGRLIDDSPGRAPNHPEFREHRHDQAILTTMAYRNGLTLHYWPASYNDGAFVYEKLPEYASDSYPILFNHHRRRNHEWPMEDLTGNGHHACYAGRGSS
jgi:hypothetical protein